MDPRKLFADERLTGFCVYCGSAPESRDHCPSKVLLDEPFPLNLPVVDACASCNGSFSLDEQYVACLIEVVLCGSVDPDRVSRQNIRRILADTPALTTRLNASERANDSDELVWEPEIDRVKSAVLKLARGHIAYELSLPKLEEPDRLEFAPLMLMSEDQRAVFESPESGPYALWPEIGSRAFFRAVDEFPSSGSSGWINVQPGRYRYLVGQSNGDFAQMVLSEYLACRVAWL